MCVCVLEKYPNLQVGYKFDRFSGPRSSRLLKLYQCETESCISGGNEASPYLAHGDYILWISFLTTIS